MTIRPLNPNSRDEIELVARRMRLTLMEVISEEEGEKMYTMDWLIDRVRFHLDPMKSEGQVFVAENESGEILGHTIVRVESGEGYFSTFYVAPEARGQSIATEFIKTGEAWMRERSMNIARTNTAKDNAKLQNLLFKFGYEITDRSENMVSLTKRL